MKKFYMILAAIAALTMAAQAQNYAEINVGNIETASTYDGSYFSMAPTTFYVAHTGAQMLYTPDLLADMNGKQNVRIKSLDFWFHCETFEEIFRDVKIYLQEVDATEFAVNDEGVKQFFTFDQPVKEMEFNIDMLDYYGEDVCLNFDFEPFAFTPGKSLLITMVFDAQDDDNCTMGSDYAPFYSSGIRSKAMTYTDNWTSFVDYAMGNDFPDATAMLGCGTNVDLPVTRIGYNYDEGTEPGSKTDAPSSAKENYVFNDGNLYYNAYTVDLIETEPSTIYYRVGILVDGEYVYGEWMEYTGQLNFDEEGTYMIEAYAIAPGKTESDHIWDGFTVSKMVDVEELFAGKTVASVRYFNLAGQEMQQANGLTIMVTTFTDGTTSAVKVVK